MFGTMNVSTFSLYLLRPLLLMGRSRPWLVRLITAALASVSIRRLAGGQSASGPVLASAEPPPGLQLLLVPTLGSVWKNFLHFLRVSERVWPPAVRLCVPQAVRQVARRSFCSSARRQVENKVPQKQKVFQVSHVPPRPTHTHTHMWRHRGFDVTRSGLLSEGQTSWSHAVLQVPPQVFIWTLHAVLEDSLASRTRPEPVRVSGTTLQVGLKVQNQIKYSGIKQKTNDPGFIRTSKSWILPGKCSKLKGFSSGTSGSGSAGFPPSGWILEAHIKHFSRFGSFWKKIWSRISSRYQPFHIMSSAGKRHHDT